MRGLGRRLPLGKIFSAGTGLLSGAPSGPCWTVVVRSGGFDIHWRRNFASILAKAAPLTPVAWRSQVAYATSS